MKSSQRLLVYILSAGAVAGSIFASQYALRSSHKPTLASATVVRKDLVSSVALSGEVKAATNVDLAFERGGTVSRAAVKVGDIVTAGAVLVSLNAADLSAQLAQAQAAQAAAEARLAAVKRGARVEDVSVSDAGVRAAQSAANEARTALIDKLQDAYTKADDAVHAKADQVLLNATSSTPHFAYFIPDQFLIDAIETNRPGLEARLSAWASRNAGLDATSDLDVAVAATRADLEVVKAYMDDVVGAVDKLTTTGNATLTNAVIDGFKANDSVARGNVLSAQANISAGMEKLRGTAAAVEVAESQKTLKAAAPAVEDVAIQEATVRQAAAAVDAVRVQLGKTSLRAPFAGVITRMDAKVGASAAPGVALVTVIGNGAYQIESIVPEADIAALKIGETATVTLDAYGTGTPFTATVAAIDPAESTVGGISGYKVTLLFAAVDDRIKSGMTANVSAITDSANSALVIPRDAVIQRGNDNFVLVVTGATSEQRKVTLGMHDANEVVVTDGLTEGEAIATFGN